MRNELFKRNLFFSLIFSIIFTILFSIGYKLDKYSNLFYPQTNATAILFCFILIFLGYFLLSQNLNKIINFFKKINIPKKFEEQFLQPNIKCFISCFIFIALFHSFSLLAHFPGIVAYDFPFQVIFFYPEGHYEVHPFLHNCFIFMAYFINKKFNSPYLGIFIHSLIQSAIMFAIFSYSIYFLAKHKVSSIIKLFTLLYFAFYPIHQVFILATTKDVIFSGLVLLFSILLMELILNKNDFIQNKKLYYSFVLIIFLMLCFRLNAIHAYLLFLPFVLFFFKKESKKIFLIFIIPLILFIGFGLTKKFYGIKPSPISATLTVPLQQMGRVRLKYDKTLPKEEKLAFRNIVSENCEKKYNPYIVDFMRIDSIETSKMQLSTFLENSLKKDPKGFIDLYFKWAKKYPKDYINAFLLTHYNNWHIDSKHTNLLVINKSDKLFKKVKDVEIGEKCLNPIARLYYNLLFVKNNFAKNLLLYILFSPAYFLWMLIICATLLANKKKYKYLPLFILPFCLVLTVIFAPTTLLRFVYYNYLILPIALAFVFSDFKKRINK